MSSAFLSAVAARRSYYPLAKSSPIPASKIQEIVLACVKDVPSSFNTQTSRAIIFFGDEHVKLWKEIVQPTYFAMVTDEATRKNYEGRINAFAGAYGTVVFFEEQTIVEAMQAKMPPLAKSFPTWSDNSAGMLQFAVWTALEAEGLGANLQHYGAYNPDTDVEILKTFSLPSTWKSTAMMPFGTPAGPAGGPNPKTFDKLDERVQVIGSA